MDARQLAVSAGLSLAAVLAYAQDQNLAGFKAPPPAPEHSPIPVQSTPAASQVAPATAPNSTAISPPLPARVLLVMPHGSVLADGSGLLFNFDKAPLPEVISAIGRGFGINLAYSGPTGRHVSGQWRCGVPEEALSYLVDRTNLQFRLEGGAWSVGEMAMEAPAKIDFLEMTMRGAAPPTGDGAPSKVPAKPGRSD
jgi:hypothetical protein